MGQHLVLVGGGHTHLHTLSKSRGILQRGHRVTLINPTPWQDYSGMAPGVLGGEYSLEEIRFPLDEIASRAGVAAVWDRVVRIDAGGRRLELASGESVAYDLASFNIGSEVAGDIPGELQHDVFPVKPVERLADLRTRIEAWAPGKPCRVAVIGGGAAGVEVAGNVRRLMDSHAIDGRVVLVAGDALFPGWPPSQLEKIREYFRRHSVELLEGVRFDAFDQGRLKLSNGQFLHFELAVMATGIRPPSLFLDSGLSTGPDGGLSVNPFLQSIDAPEIFAAGDCLHYVASPLSKVGVYAVRQGPVLTHNLISALEEHPLSTYSPQQTYLQIVNLGDRRASLHRPPLNLFGVLPWRVKDWIDRRFVSEYQPG